MYVQYLYGIHITATAIRCNPVGGRRCRSQCNCEWPRAIRRFHQGSVSLHQFLSLVPSINGGLENIWDAITPKR